MDNDYASFAVPLGTTTKMDGCAAVYPAIATVFIANLFGVQLGVWQYVAIVAVAVFGALATAGTTGWFTMLTLTLGAVNMPPEVIATAVLLFSARLFQAAASHPALRRLAIALGTLSVSTLLGLVLGFLRPTAGQITVGEDAPREYLRTHGASYLPDGGAVCNITLATSETWKDKNTGDKQEKTEWHRVVVFNEALCKVIEQYVKKGAKLYIEGQSEPAIRLVIMKGSGALPLPFAMSAMLRPDATERS